MDERYIEIEEAHQRRLLENAIEIRVRYEGESALECIRCGDEIPEGRRLALPGIKVCVDCASTHRI